MKTIYLVKKNPAMPKAEDNWIIMNGREFWQFISTEEGKLRSLDFGRMDPCGLGDYAIIAECGKEDALAWHRERSRQAYLSAQQLQKGIEVLSYELILENIDDGHYLPGMADPDSDIERPLFLKAEWESIRIAFIQLPVETQELLHALIACDTPITMSQYAASKGMPYETVRKHRKRALARLKQIYVSMCID